MRLSRRMTTEAKSILMSGCSCDHSQSWAAAACAVMLCAAICNAVLVHLLALARSWQAQALLGLPAK